MENKYQALDEAILKNIASGKTNFTTMQSGDVSTLSNVLVNGTRRQPFRLVDGRLQSLRKRGLIEFDSKSGWSKTSAK